MNNLFLSNGNPKQNSYNSGTIRDLKKYHRKSGENFWPKSYCYFPCITFHENDAKNT